MSEESLVEKYCKYCKNREKIYLCVECFYDMRFFEDNRFININILKSINKDCGTIRKDGYIIYYEIREEGG